MSVSVSKTLLFSSMINVKFSDLRSSFKETTSGSVSASELKRNTITTNSNPIVPDATENTNVSTGNNLKLSQFTNTIKYYDLNQTGTDLNLNLVTQTWNSNLNKNIVKRVNINGTCGSTSVSSPALTFNDLAYNLRIIVNGFVYGTGGSSGTSGNGGSGGNAMSITSLGGAVIVRTNNGSQVYGGGGGGAKGGTGANGTPSYCYYVTSRTITCSATCECCPNCNANESSGGCNCFSNCYQRRRTRCNYNRTCYLNNYYYSTTPTGGTGGNGGLGQGYSQTRSNGSIGGSSTTPNCNPYSTATAGSAGATGETGGNGGDWGSDGVATTPYVGGTAGRAIAGSNYTIDSSSVSAAFKGLK